MKIYIFIHNVLCILVFVQQYSLSTSYYHEQSIKRIKPPKNSINDTYFGYSVTYVPSNKRFIAGAPKIFIRGAVYECDIFNNTCIENNPTIKLSNEKLSERDGYWLGAAVEAGSNFYIVCAPRASNGLVGMFGVEGTAGLCFYRDFTEAQNSNWLELSTLHKELMNVHQCGPNNIYSIDTCQDSFGWSISVYNKSILIGGPAIYTGRIGFYADRTTKPQIRQGMNGTHGYGYTVLIRPINDSLRFLVSSNYAPKGMVEILDFDNNLKLIKESKGRIEENYLDPLSNTMYGAALSLIKHENEDYMLVGAPSYSSDEPDRFDLGRVYIYNLAHPVKTGKMFQWERTIEGQNIRGYFGYFIINVGDLNADGTDDVAISAPFEDNGKGAVYIYSGAELPKSSKKLQPVQRIQPENAVHLGLSMTPMSDLDDNGCSALGIGAPGSDTAFVLHCISTATVKLTVDPLPNLQGRKYSTSDKVNETYFSFPWCLNIVYPEKLKSIELDLHVIIELKHEFAKLVKIGEDKLENNVIVHNFTLREKKTQICKETTINLPADGNYEKAMELSIKTTETNDPRLDKEFNPSKVMVSDHSLLEFGPKQLWATECRNQEACFPNLDGNVITTLSKNYVIGSTEKESFTISVNNYGDTAYQSCVTVKLNGVYAKPPPDCKEWVPNEWICRSLSPLKNMSTWTMDTTLEMGLLNSNAKEINYLIAIKNDCITTSKYITDIYLLRNDVERVTIRGTDNIEGLLYIRDNEPKQVNHKYEIINNGTTNWVDFKFKLNIKKHMYIDGYTTKNLQISTEGSPIPTNCIPIQRNDSIDLVCNIESFNRGQTITVSLDTTISSTDNINNNVNITVDSALSILLDKTIKSQSVQSILQIQKPFTPIWMIIISVLFGIVLFVIMAFIMYEFGCFKRKDKIQLENLRSSIRRQTMRKSTSEAFESRKSAEREQIVDDDLFFDEGSYNNVNITVDSALSIILGETIKFQSVQSILQIQKPFTPIWIIIISVLFGIVLFVIMAFIMYEFGCFERKDKIQLENLRSSIRRQTMRKSTSEAFESRKSAEKEQIVDDDFFFDDGSCAIIASPDNIFADSSSTPLHS